MIEEVLAKKYPLKTLVFWQPARMCSSWWMTEATNAARAPCHTIAHTSVFCLSWKSTVKGRHAYSCWGGAKEYLLLAASFHTASVSSPQWFPELFEDPLIGDLRNKIHMSLFDHNWVIQLTKRMTLLPVPCAFKPLATSHYVSVKFGSTTLETKVYWQEQHSLQNKGIKAFCTAPLQCSAYRRVHLMIT